MIINFDRSAPRWIVFAIDMGISLVALITAYLLRFNFAIPEPEYNNFAFVFTLVLFLKGLSFYLFKTHSGIIRHTSLNDFLRIFVSVFCVLILLGLLNVVSFISDSVFLVPYSVLIIDFLLTFFLMGTFRTTVKIMFHELQRSSKDRIHVIIFGAGESGVTTKRALDRVTDVKYNVVAFFDDSTTKSGKRLEGVTILPGDQLEDFLINHRVDQLIIAAQQMDTRKKSTIVELALNYRIKTLNVPAVTDWINGELNVKQLKKVRIEDLLGRKQIQLNMDRIREQIRGKRVLITGAAGSIGSGLVRQVARYQPDSILMLDQAETPLYEIELEVDEKYGKGTAEVVIGDIRDRNRMENMFRTFRPEIVYHAAAYKHVPLMENNPAEAIKTNVSGTMNLVDLADEYGVEKFVMVSTDKAVNPTNVMGASKRIAEIYAQSKNTGAKKTKYITTRFGNVLGSNGSVIPIFRKQIEQGGPLTVTHAEITRFFMTIPEACQLVLEAGMMGAGGEIFIFDMGESVKIVDLAKKMIRLSGLEVGKDIEIKFTGLRPGEKLYEELLADEENTQKTHHPQIMIAQVRTYDFEEVSQQIHGLTDLYHAQDNVQIVAKMKEIVPEFLSRNSKYTELDKLKA